MRLFDAVRKRPDENVGWRCDYQYLLDPDKVPGKGLSHYCAARAVLKMLWHCTALEWAELGIRIVNVSPGAVETDINREAIENLAERIGSRQAAWVTPATRLEWRGFSVLKPAVT